jgi:hypothetical protein
MQLFGDRKQVRLKRSKTSQLSTDFNAADFNATVHHAVAATARN